MHRRFCILGAGGLAREVFLIIRDLGMEDRLECFIDAKPDGKELFGYPVKPVASFTTEFQAILAVGYPETKRRILHDLPEQPEFLSRIHPSVSISPWTKLGKGVIVGPQCVITCDNELGDFVVLNPMVAIPHDCVIGDFCTAAYGVK